MNADEVRARLPIIGEDDDGPTGQILLGRETLPHGGTATHAVDVDAFVELFGDVDLSDLSAAVAADQRKVRVDRVHRRTHFARPDGTFDADAPAVDPDDVIEQEVELGYRAHLERWHNEGRFS